MSTWPNSRIGTPMSTRPSEVVAELQPDGPRPVDREPLAGMRRSVRRAARAAPAVAEEEFRALVPDVVDEQRAAPMLAFEPHAEVAGLVLGQLVRSARAHDGLDAFEARDRLADVGEVEPRERL